MKLEDQDPFAGAWNEETDERNPLDWSKCWSVYDFIADWEVKNERKKH